MPPFARIVPVIWQMQSCPDLNILADPVDAPVMFAEGTVTCVNVVSLFKVPVAIQFLAVAASF